MSVEKVCFWGFWAYLLSWSRNPTKSKGDVCIWFIWLVNNHVKIIQETFLSREMLHISTVKQRRFQNCCGKWYNNLTYIFYHELKALKNGKGKRNVKQSTIWIPADSAKSGPARLPAESVRPPCWPARKRQLPIFQTKN